MHIPDLKVVAFLEEESPYTPIEYVSGPEVYIQLQYNLIHSKMGNHLSEMKFDSDKSGHILF